MAKKIKVKNKIEQDVITPQYKHIKELAYLKYEAEEKREQNLIQQSCQLQTAFSFMTAAIFMAVPICIEYRGVLSLKFFLISTSVIVAFLLASLLLASIAQWRWKTKAFPNIQSIKEAVINSKEWEKLCIEYHQIDQLVTLMGEVQAKKTELNDKRVKLIMASMICFYASVITIIVFFVIAIFILL